MPLTAGTRLGNYEIIAPIGKGGMGEVYRAHDSKLRREVALKVLPEAFARDGARMQRFQREAQLLAALNHPNIASIYGLEDFDGRRALVMELVEGDTLADKIAAGPVAEAEAVHIARQMAAALEYAHDKGIVHRDLKPANVKLTDRNVVKILDFGLAKAMGDDRAASADPDNSPTLTMGSTQAGVILGTAAYMAPEQARGKAVDKRADIWAYGVVLYEMVAGRRPFAGEDMSEILASVIKEQPKWERAPAKFQLLLHRCLEKDPAQRLRDIGDAMPLLDLAPAEISHQGNRRGIPWMAAAIAFFVIAAVALPFAIARWREQPPSRPQVRFEVPPPPKGNFDVYMALSPDGRKLAFTSFGPDSVLRIWLRDLDTVQSRAIEGTENAQSLFWSPDSRFIAFGFGNQLKKVDIAGGPPVTLCDSSSPVGSGAWSKTGVVVFGGKGTGPLQKVPEAGGVPTPLTALDSSHGEGYHSHPSFLADGIHFLYYRSSGDTQRQGIYVGSLDAKPAEQSAKRLLASNTNAVFAPADGGAGDILFLRDGTLMAQPLDTAKFELTGEPVPLAESVGSTNSFGSFSVSATGMLAYHAGGGAAGSELVWMDRSGKRLEVAAPAGNYNFETLSPDGKTIAYERATNGQGGDLWLYDLTRGTTTRFTFSSSTVATPVWSPDGSHIAYAAGTPQDIYQKLTSGAAKEELLVRLARGLRIYDWSPDGKYIVYGTLSNNSPLWLLPMQGEHKPVTYFENKFTLYDAQFSPDSRWIAYTSNESGMDQVYVQPIPASGAKWQISTSGGNRVRWRRDGKEMYYIDDTQTLVSVSVKGGATLEAGTPQALFRTPIARVNQYQFFYTPSPDGRKFLVKLPAGSAMPSPITVVLNWRAGRQSER